MTPPQFIAITVTLLIFVGLPLMIAIDYWKNAGKKASDRPTHTSTAAAFLGALDRIVRPSVEHRIEEENRMVKDEEDVGGE